MERYLKNVLRSSIFVGVEEKRSQTMAAIRGKGNRTTELALRMAMVRAGITGWTMHPGNVPGKPDFFFRKHRLAIFVDGCFWHNCPTCGHTPKTRRKFWAAKFQRNKARDLATTTALKQMGIKAVRVWEHSLKSYEQKAAVMLEVTDILDSERRKSSRNRR